jgi:Fe-S oxidoreductase
MATYKAEFLSHHYKGRLRPAAAYSMGQIMHAARVGTRFPRLTNLVTHAPGLGRAAKRLAGVAAQRDVPRFARQSFRRWFRTRPPRNGDRPPVLLWPDTFNDAFGPEVLQAGVQVLEAAGFQVRVPDRWLCCGRPLYDFGLLGQARRRLHQVLRTLRSDIRAGVPVVGLEPSCAAVFRDELVNLFPNDQDARRLSQQTFVLSEFLEQRAPGFELPHMNASAVVHGHCHHKAVMGFAADERLLDRLGLRYEVLDSGCCGMAGAFGFERDHYDISMAIGERKLLPAVRDADDDAFLLADGFSCREQIRQGTNRRARHVAEVIASGLSEGTEATA